MSERLGILFLHHTTDEVVRNNLRHLRAQHPDATVVTMGETETFPGGYSFAATPALHPFHAIDRRQGADWLVASWFLQRKERCDRWWIVEWDVYCTMPVQEYYGPVWHHPFVCSVTRIPHRDPEWFYFRKRRHVPPALRGHRLAAVPFLYLITDEALTRTWEALLEGKYRFGNSEMRVATLANLCGFAPCGYSPPNDQIGWMPLRAVTRARGIFHPVKFIPGSAAPAERNPSKPVGPTGDEGVVVPQIGIPPTEKKHPAIILVPYFGKWPPWLPLYLHSCRLNPKVAWLLIGDAPAPKKLPPNVRFLSMTMAEYLARISAQTGLEHQMLYPYKICDFKPLLGAAFADEISDYQFFGWGDLDLVYGRFEELALPLLADHDIISFSRRPLSNYTCLFRNAPEFRNLYRRIPFWRRKLGRTHHTAFDDLAFGRVALITGRVWKHECFTTPSVRGCPWPGGSHPKSWTWNSGQVTNNANPGFQFAFFHFMVWKTGPKRGYHPANARQWPAGTSKVTARDISKGCAFNFTENGIRAEPALPPNSTLPVATELNISALV